MQLVISLYFPHPCVIFVLHVPLGNSIELPFGTQPDISLSEYICVTCTFSFLFFLFGCAVSSMGCWIDYNGHLKIFTLLVHEMGWLSICFISFFDIFQQSLEVLLFRSLFSLVWFILTYIIIFVVTLIGIIFFTCLNTIP